MTLRELLNSDFQFYSRSTPVAFLIHGLSRGLSHPFQFYSRSTVYPDVSPMVIIAILFQFYSRSTQDAKYQHICIVLSETFNSIVDRRIDLNMWSLWHLINIDPFNSIVDRQPLSIHLCEACIYHAFNSIVDRRGMRSWRTGRRCEPSLSIL